jgi:F5/8 type C domain/Fibronectin type III domain
LPGSQSVGAGNGTSYTVTVGALNGFNGTVSLSASGLPSGASANFNPTSITGSGTSTMSVTTSNSTPIGTSTLTITGTFGSTNHTTTVILNVVNLSAGAQPVSINFVGAGSDNTLSSGQSAGVVSEANWNNASGVSGSGLSLNDNNGALTTAALTWSANHTTTESLTNTAPNYVLMNGSINAVSGTTNVVTVSGLTNNANGWTVYVYCEENTGGATRTAAYQISGSGITTTTIDATDPGLFGGTFTQANNSTGNYVVFTIGNVSGFTITATPVSASDGLPRAPLNGIQYIPITSGTPPQPPTGLMATPGNAQVALSWNASTGATSYNVKRSTTSGGPYTTITNVTTTSDTDTGLSNGTTYYYVVSALNTNGESANSSQVSATPGPPPTPTGLTATPGNAQVALSWNSSTGATSYNVKNSTTNGGPYTTITNVTTTSYTDTGLVNGTTYYFVVSALNAAGESTNSSQVSATPTSSTLLSQDQPVMASSFQAGNVPTNGNDGNFTTRWAASSDTYPQWWSVDLGAPHNLQQANIYWYDSTTRSYKFEIQVSSDDTNFTTVVNETNNVTDGDTTNTFSASDRYVRVYVTGSSDATGFASFYECQIYGN